MANDAATGTNVDNENESIKKKSSKLPYIIGGTLLAGVLGIGGFLYTQRNQQGYTPTSISKNVELIKIEEIEGGYAHYFGQLGKSGNIGTLYVLQRGSNGTEITVVEQEDRKGRFNAVNFLDTDNNNTVDTMREGKMSGLIGPESASIGDISQFEDERVWSRAGNVMKAVESPARTELGMFLPGSEIDSKFRNISNDLGQIEEAKRGRDTSIFQKTLEHIVH